MKPFPVKIDMSEFFDDKHKMVMLLVDRGWETIEMLEHRLKSLFNITAVEFMSDEGYYIPPQEPIKLLKHVQLLKALKPKETKSTVVNEFQRVIEPLIEKRKFYSLGNDVATNATPKQKKRKRSSALTNAANELQGNGQEKHKANKDLRAFLDRLVVDPKKKSRGKKTSIEAKTPQNLNNQDTELLSTSSPNKSLRIPAPRAATEATNQSTHTFFSETGNTTDSESGQPAEDIPAAKVIFRCNLRQIDNIQPRVFKIPGTVKCSSNQSEEHAKGENGISKAFALKSPQSDDKHDENRNMETVDGQIHNFESSTQSDVSCNSSADSTERSIAVNNSSAVHAIAEAVETDQHANASMIQPAERTAKTLNIVSSDDTHTDVKEITYLTEEESEIIDLNETDIADFTNEFPTIEKMLTGSTDLLSMPAVGQTILFKLASSDKPGTISKYIAGKLDHLNKRTKTLKFFIIDGHEELCNFSAKYACDLNNTTNTHIFYIKYSDLIEPKVCLEIN